MNQKPVMKIHFLISINTNGDLIMAKINHLKRIADILWNQFDEEIKYQGDWFWATRNWEINFTFDDEREIIVAYPRKKGDTDWSKPIVLSERVRKWKTIV